MAATRLSEVERAYFVRKASGAQPSEPFNNLKRRYMASQVSTVAHESLDSIEDKWLKKVIDDAGGDSSASNLWTEVVAAIGETPSKYENDNKIIFYTNAS